jgi:hypothetical protein
LRGLHLDSACAPALSQARENRDQSKISSDQKCPRFEGNPALADPGQSNTNGTQLQMGRYLGDGTMQPWHVSFHNYPNP